MVWPHIAKVVPTWSGRSGIAAPFPPKNHCWGLSSNGTKKIAKNNIKDLQNSQKTLV